MGLFSVIALALIPMPMFMIGSAIFFHFARAESAESAGSRLFKLIWIVFALILLIGGVVWLLMCAAIWSTGAFI